MKNFFKNKSLIVAAFFLFVLSTGAFCEGWTSIENECTVLLSEWERPPIMLVNNTSQYVQIVGSSEVIKPYSSASINAKQVTFRVSVTAEFSGDTNSTIVYVNDINRSSQSTSGLKEYWLQQWKKEKDNAAYWQSQAEQHYARGNMDQYRWDKMHQSQAEKLAKQYYNNYLNAR